MLIKGPLLLYPTYIQAAKYRKNNILTCRPVNHLQKSKQLWGGSTGDWWFPSALSWDNIIIFKNIFLKKTFVSIGRITDWLIAWLIDWLIYGWIDIWIDGWMDVWIDGWRDGWIDWLIDWLIGYIVVFNWERYRVALTYHGTKRLYNSFRLI